MERRKYYTNGTNEKRLYSYEPIPQGYYLGRLKSPITTKDKYFINDGKVEKFINKTDVIPEGYVKGRIKENLNPIKQSKTLRNQERHYYNNGAIEISLKKDDTIPDGFILGRLPMKEMQKSKLSDSHLGKTHTLEARLKISQHSNNNRDKAFITISKKYGSKENFYKLIHSKGDLTKGKNNTFNTSKPELLYLEYLKSVYSPADVFTHYKSANYPFYCDFYIKSEDRYIELNLHWTHGGRPYDPNDEECQKQLAIWQEKAKTSQFYKNAIETWTVRDVAKLNWAREHNLNYEVIYLLDKIL